MSEPSIDTEPHNIFLVNNFFDNLKNLKDVVTLGVELQSIYLYLVNLKYNYLKDQP